MIYNALLPYNTLSPRQPELSAVNKMRAKIYKPLYEQVERLMMAAACVTRMGKIIRGNL